ncbi:MAG TPA: alpha/beta hydrolase family protein [Cryptosporangiaceae bacterium]|nr:alpha/beta hydrolase family protein [Cryptosporangiaceae bacterium]
MVTVEPRRRVSGTLRPWLVAVVVAAVMAGCGGSGDTTTARPSKPSVRVVSVEKVDVRTRDLLIDSPAVGQDVTVRLLLPAGFEAQPDRRWPVLYLLHGANDPDTYLSWTRSTDVAALTAKLDVLVAMPEGGTDGHYSNWWNDGRGGPPAWETFHLVELLQVLERDWRASDRRAVAGLSMGGLGAMLYAARSPKRFQAAASFSGLLDTFRWSDFPMDLWGDRVEQRDVWRRHNPVEVAADLRGVALLVSYGDGRQGPLDAELNSVGGRIEHTLAAGNRAFVQRLRALGIPAQVRAYGPGTHSWPYWQRELRLAMPAIMKALAT